ncbi:deoxyribodipyrimidine photolyase, FAD-binding [Escherichia coli]|uniref:Deoxyribodipyrimidine photolyase, FAD-binding n=1 Tax=Escherichia coli TaxID=562 RepID=A0A376RMF9_ECOLX|nr:deoxyribodipyrimidine photolyase, FAD-binding [Escherichia coli]
MITASFLVKDLLIDWREGERYFMSQLIDGDLAAITVAGSGRLLRVLMLRRIFVFSNPITQAKFDREGEFIRRWLPELRDVPGKAVHEPWKWAQKAGVKLDYPQPIVDHKRQGCERGSVRRSEERSLIKRSERFIRYGAGLL